MGGAAVLGVFGAAQVLSAVVSWPQHPVGSAYMSDRLSQRRATALGWHTAGGGLGTMAVPLLLSAVVVTAGWRRALVALGAALATGGLLVNFALPLESHESGKAERPARHAGRAARGAGPRCQRCRGG